MARDLVVTENITVDSVIDAAGDWFLPSGADDARDVAEPRHVEAQPFASGIVLLRYRTR
jgi:hypothetical protein